MLGRLLNYNGMPLSLALQNNLKEFYSMCDFAQPGLLGTPAAFNRIFAEAIVAGSRPNAEANEKALAESRTNEVRDYL
jgi:SNF2 family DNA or RNA helicase